MPSTLFRNGVAELAPYVSWGESIAQVFEKTSARILVVIEDVVRRVKSVAVPGVAEMQDVDTPYHVLIVLEGCLQELYHNTHLPLCRSGLSHIVN